MNTVSIILSMFSPFIAGITLDRYGDELGMRFLYGALSLSYIVIAIMNLRFLKETMDREEVSFTLKEIPIIIKEAYTGLPSLLKKLPTTVRGMALIIILGFSANGRYFLVDGFGLGWHLGYNNYYEKDPYETYYFEGGAISASHYNYTFTIPFKMDIFYHYKPDGIISPYVGIGIGGNYMTTNNIDKYSVNTPDISSINKENIDKPANIKEQKDEKIDPCLLRESLKAKRQLITLLEKGGYVKDMDFESIKADVNKAIADLDTIIGELEE